MSGRAAVYARVSTDEQVEGTSLDTQTEACIALARERGYEVPEDHVIREQQSGASLRRPGLDRLREMAERGLVGAIVFYHVDRLSRDAVDLMILLREFNRHRVETLAVREPPEDTTLGRAFTFLRGTFSELERREIVERTMRGKRARAREGRIVQATGAGMYGYFYDATTKKRVVVAPQADIVRRVFGQVADGISINAVARLLNDDGVQTLTGKRWHPLTIRRMVTNYTYTGLTYFGRTRRVAGKVELRPEGEWIAISGATPAIIPTDVFEAVQRALQRPGRRVDTKPRKNLLSGHIWCGLCDGRLTGSVLQKKYAYYYCRRNWKRYGATCTLKYQRAEPLEASVWADVRDVLEHPERVMEEVRRRKAEAAPHLRDEPEKLRREIDRHKFAEARLLRAYAFGDRTASAVQEEIQRVSAERAGLERRLAETEQHLAEVEYLATAELQIGEYVERVRSNLDTLDFEGKRLALEALEIEVHVFPDHAELRGFLPVVPHHCTNIGITTCT